MNTSSIRAAATTPIGTSILAGMLGSVIAVVVGRPQTRLDNALIGGLFTGFAAYRDPRSSFNMTLLVAVIEGAIWGITDRTTPLIKNALLPPAEPPTEVMV
jgi:hypothetical protein